MIVLQLIKRVWMSVKANLLYLWRKHLFKEYHKSVEIKRPILLTPKYIELGNNIFINYHSRIEGISTYAGVIYHPNIRVCDGVSIQQNLHLTCAKSIIIGKNTAIAANVTITDIHHPYEDINTPIEKQRLEVKEVNIGEDSKVYNNVVILPGVNIGKHVTIGANSVVANSIPDYSVAVGQPARVVKRYDFNLKRWRKTDKDGNFLI